MENKINIAEILKDCPQGMELDCTLFDDDVTVIFDGVDVVNEYATIIKITVIHDGNRSKHTLTKYGQWNPYKYAKCVIFPKDKTTWEGFVPPRKFKDGDVVVAEDRANVPQQLFLLKHVTYRENNNGYNGYCYFGWDFRDNRLFEEGTWGFNRLATEEEKTKLFDTIKANGYEWNEGTKTLEKLIEPKPKFKVGDRIKYRSGEIVYRVVQITEDTYVLDNLCSIPILMEHMYNLVPDKFDINSLIPFESRVLVRSTNDDIWRPAMYGFTDSDRYYVVGGIYWNQCIPYEGNEHLLGKTNDCSDLYKTWK